jgi:hypothetical protein
MVAALLIVILMFEFRSALTHFEVQTGVNRASIKVAAWNLYN